MTMKPRQPNHVAFEQANDPCTMAFSEAQARRSDEFWDEVESEFTFTSADGKDLREADHCPDCIQAARNKVKELTLHFINKHSCAISQGATFNLPGNKTDWPSWDIIKFIIAFDTSFGYLPDEFQDAADPEAHIETDYLDDEAAFRFDVVKACDRLALEGAALSWKIGATATYELWAAAMVKLNDSSKRVQCEAVDDILNALVRTWSDLRTWTFLNPPHIAQKPASKRKKSKK